MSVISVNNSVCKNVHIKGNNDTVNCKEMYAFINKQKLACLICRDVNLWGFHYSF